MRCSPATALCTLWCLALVFNDSAAALRAAVDDKTDATTNVNDASACQRCADGGDCSHAYRGGAGQFCGNWIDRSGTQRPCCCPTGATCRVSTYACRCSYAGDSVYPYAAHPAAWRFDWVWWLLGIILLCVCCGPCCFFAFQRRRRREGEQIPEAVPVDGNTPNYRGNPVAGLPAVEPQTYYPGGYGPSGYGPSGAFGRTGGMGAGTGAALGGTAGLLGGLLLGEALADAGPHYGDGGFAGGVDGFDGGGGGGDFSGDF